MPKTIGYKPKRMGAKWVDRVVRAKQLLSHAQDARSARERVWRRADDYYKGNQWDGAEGDSDALVVPYVFSTVTTIIPYVTANPPQFRVEPYSKDATMQQAREQTAYLNRTWRTQRVDGNRHLRHAAFDSALYGIGYLMPSYTVTAIEREDSAFGSTDIAEVWVDRISPWDVWLDPDADSLANSRYVIRRYRKSVWDLKQDKSYSNTSDLTASQSENADSDRNRTEATLMATDDDADMIVEVFEFYDLQQRWMVTFTQQSDKPLKALEDVTVPIVDLPNNELPGSPYAIGDVEMIFVLQDEINTTRTQLMEHRKRNVNKWITRRGLLDSDAQDALRSNETNSMVEVDTDEPLQNVVMSLAPASPAADIYQSYATAKEDVYEVTGLSEYVRGGTPSIRKTATEASIIEAATNVKTQHKLKSVERAARMTGQLLLDISKEIFPKTDVDEASLVLTGRQAQQVSGDPLTASLKLTPDAEMWGVGKFEVFVEVGSTELRNPAEREQKYKDLFLTLFPQFEALQMMGIQVNFQKILELWFEAAGVEDLEAMFGQGTQPPMMSPDMMMGAEGAVPGLAPGQPNFDGAAPPIGIDELNSGMLPPVGI